MMAARICGPLLWTNTGLVMSKAVAVALAVSLRLILAAPPTVLGMILKVELLSALPATVRREGKVKVRSLRF